MTYLITGGAGFVGSHLADLLIRQGHTVHVVDNLSTGRRANVRHLVEQNRFSLTIDDVENEELLAERTEEADVVFHMAAAVGVFLTLDRPVDTIETNVEGTRSVLSAAARNDTRVLLASSSEVYGKSRDLPYREDGDMVLGPADQHRWSYACSKAVDEFLGISYWNETGVPVIIARLFNTSGPRQTGEYGMVLPRFVTQAMQGGPITVYGDGRQRRCFAHVKDVVNGLVQLVRCENAAGKIYNIGNDREISIMRLAETVREKVNPDATIETIPYEEAYGEGFEDVPRRVPDLTRIRKAIGYEPDRTIDDIIEDVITCRNEE